MEISFKVSALIFLARPLPPSGTFGLLFFPGDSVNDQRQKDKQINPPARCPKPYGPAGVDFGSLWISDRPGD